MTLLERPAPAMIPSPKPPGIAPTDLPEPPRDSDGTGTRWHGWIPVAIVVLGTVAMTLPVVWGGVRLGQDTATQFYPWYDNLGERLRTGGVPEWNPHQFGGAPLAADPQSGWMYLPAMLFFTLLPFGAAVVAQIFCHLLLANAGVWLLARWVGLGQVGALVAGFSFAGSGVLYGRIPSGPASYQAGAWLPWVLLGAEVALRARTWPVRIGGWALAGFAVSQALAAWIGQVSYYILLLLGAWLVFRVLWGRAEAVVEAKGGWAAVRSPLATAGRTPGWLPRIDRVTLGRLVLHGAVMLAIGLGLSAAGVLPRLEFNAVSNAAGGEYATEVGAVIGGSTSESVIGRLFQPSLYYPGGAVLALAVAGVLLGRRRFGVPFWLFSALGAIILTIPIETPLHGLLYVLPRFRELHEHWPERVILVVFPGLAMMAGAGAQVLVDAARQVGHTALRLAAVVVPGLVLIVFEVLEGQISWIATGGVAAVTGVAALLLFRDHQPRLAAGGARDGGLVRWLPRTLVLVVLADLMLMNQALAGQAPFGGFHRRDLDTYYAPSGAAAFLQEQAETDGPFRFAGYDPAVQSIENGLPVFYRYQFPDRITQELSVNNRATVLGLEDVQGYNPLQLQAWVDLVTAMNGAAQEYHGSDVYPAGLESPLLDLIGVRFVIVPSAFGPDRTDLARLVATWPTVYGDGTARVVENPEVLPRIWAVTETITVGVGEALPLLASGQIDPATTAVFETGIGPTAPALMAAPDGAPEPVLTLTETTDPDVVRFSASITSDTLVVLSEIAYPAWSARIDGEPVELLTVDHALWAVVVPAGEHEVTLSYESTATRYGLAITMATLLAVVAAWAVAVWRSRRVSYGLKLSGAV